ncbi:MAG: tetraacyldisaccharide 4'-kinase [Paenacidovorax caeni]
MPAHRCTAAPRPCAAAIPPLEAVDAQGQRHPLAALRGQPVYAVAAVARPEEFFAQLRACGLHVAQAQALPDHYDFGELVALCLVRLRG